MAKDGLICWSCGKPTGLHDRILRTDACPKCQSDLRTCRGCRHFDPSMKYQCREKVEYRVTDKNRTNPCDWFQVREVSKVAGGVQTRNAGGKASAKKSFDDLFKD